MSRAVADRFKLAGVASVAMLGSAVPVLVEQMTGQSLVSYGTWGASIGALMNVAGNVISGYLGNRVTSDADQARQKDDLLQNADWLKLTSLAVASLIREHGKDQTHYAGQLNALADRIEAQWLSLADTPEYEATLRSLDRQSAIRYFHSAAQLDPAQRRALDVDTWVALFRSVSETGKPILTTEDQPHLDEDRLRRLASVIHEQFSTAVYRLLKNPAFGGKACIGLILTMLGQTHEAVCLRLPQMVDELRSENQETRASLQQWGTRLQEEYQRLRAVADAPAHPRFDRYFQDQEDHWQVAYENFNALHQQGAAHLAQGDQILAAIDGLQQIVVPAAPVAPTRISTCTSMSTSGGCLSGARRSSHSCASHCTTLRQQRLPSRRRFTPLEASARPNWRSSMPSGTRAITTSSGGCGPRRGRRRCRIWRHWPNRWG